MTVLELEVKKLKKLLADNRSEWELLVATKQATEDVVTAKLVS